MKLTVSAVGGHVVLADPNPTEGVLNFSVGAGASVTKTVSNSQYERLLPQLRALAVKKNTLGTQMMTYSIADDEALDDGPALTAIPALSWAETAAYDVSAGAATFTVKGTDLLGDQAKAVLTVGELVLTAVRPGAAGNNITVELVVAGNLTALTVPAVVGTAIVVNLETDAGGVAISTPNQVRDAINAVATARALVIASTTANATAPVALAATHLAGGVGPGFSAKFAGVDVPVVSVDDTTLVLNVPANVGGITGTWPVKLAVTTGAHVLDMTIPTVV